MHIRRHKTDTQFVVPIYDHLRPLLDRMNRARRGKRSPASLVFKIKDAKKVLGAACERLKLLFWGRVQGLPPPWTNDPVLQTYKFTNA